MEGGGVFGRLWSGVINNKWKALMFTIPAALATGYAIWKMQRERCLPSRSRDVETPALHSESTEVDAQTTAATVPLTASLPSDGGSFSSKPFPSPTDSGFEEPGSPGKPKCQDSNFSATLTPHPLPPTPSSIPLSMSTIDTTVIRGGRARATIQLPIDIIGRFIGRQGKNIKSLMAESGAQIHVQQKNLSKDATIVPCILQGTQGQITKAIDLVCLRHPEVTLPSSPMYVPPISIYSNTMSNGHVASWDYTLKPPQPPTSVFLAIVTYIEKLNRIWLVPYSSTQLLEELHQSMAQVYTKTDENSEEENGEEPDERCVGKYCSVRVNEVYWLRGKVSSKNEGVHYEVRLMDYGSSVIVPFSSLKPLRKEHTQIPIQSFPFLLSNIEPINSDSEDSMLVLQALVEGAVLEAHPTGRISSDDDCTPYLELYTQSQHSSDGQTFINRELVNQGFAVWREVQPGTSPILPLSPLSTRSTCQLVQNDEEDPAVDQPSVTRSLNSASTTSDHMIPLMPRSVTLSDLLSAKPTNESLNENCSLSLPTGTAEAPPPIDPIKALFGDQLPLLSHSGSS